MLSSESEVLLRNQQYFENGRWLIVNATDSEIFSYFPKSVVGLHQLYDGYLNIHSQARGFHHFGPTLSSDNSFDGAIIYWPKSKQHGVMLCHYVSTLLENEGHLLIVGDNKGGVKSAAKALNKIGLSMNKIDSARHCTLIGTLVEDSDAIVHDKFNISKYVNTYSVKTDSHELSLETLPGGFSSDALDPGSALLLSTLDDLFNNNNAKKSLPPIKVLDFACGNGAIGLSIAASQAHTHVTLSDINALALTCAKSNVSRNNIDNNRVDIVTSNGLDEVTGQFDLIVSNPPFHSGTKTDYSITERFLIDAKKQLRPNGKLQIVANRFLKYPDQLEQVFGNFRVVAQTTKFNVYQSIHS